MVGKYGSYHIRPLSVPSRRELAVHTTNGVRNAVVDWRAASGYSFAESKPDVRDIPGVQQGAKRSRCVSRETRPPGLGAPRLAAVSFSSNQSLGALTFLAHFAMTAATSTNGRSVAASEP